MKRIWFVQSLVLFVGIANCSVVEPPTSTSNFGRPLEEHNLQHLDDQFDIEDEVLDWELSVGVVTWNLGEASPAPPDMDFLKGLRGCDLVLLGAQETENIKPRREEGSRSREWRRLQIRKLGKRFVPVALHAMGGLQLSVLVRRELAPRLTAAPQVAEVACGIGNVLTNKGALCCFLEVDGRPLALVNCHLAAHHTKVAERNADFRRIVAELNLALPPRWARRWDARAAAQARRRGSNGKGGTRAGALARTSARGRSAGTAGDPYWEDGEEGRSSRGGYDWARMEEEEDGDDDEEGETLSPEAAGERLRGACSGGIFWCGDLNYRCERQRADLEAALLDAPCTPGDNDIDNDGGSYGTLESSKLRELFIHDQLSGERAAGRAFAGFREARLGFNPTYKYDKGGPALDSSKKQRIPAWTDRILYSYPLGLDPEEPALRRDLEVEGYWPVFTSQHSDHRPVVGRYRLREFRRLEDPLEVAVGAGGPPPSGAAAGEGEGAGEDAAEETDKGRLSESILDTQQDEEDILEAEEATR